VCAPAHDCSPRPEINRAFTALKLFTLCKIHKNVNKHRHKSELFPINISVNQITENCLTMLIGCPKQNPWELKSFRTVKKNRPLWYSKAQNHAHDSVYALIPYLRAVLILSSHIHLDVHVHFPIRLFPSGSPSHIHEFLMSPMRATCLFYLILSH
jgi:hypothetical protein